MCSILSQFISIFLRVYLFKYSFKTKKVYKHDIYPKELDLSSDNKNDQQVHYLDLDILIVGSGFSYCIYDKRDNFNFPIVNFPDLSGNIPACQSYNVFISQLVRYARGCMHFQDFKTRCVVNYKTSRTKL